MKNVKVHDYAEDDSTTTVRVLTATTMQDCAVSEREFLYDNLETGETDLTGVEIILQTIEEEDEPVYKTLDELTAESAQAEVDRELEALADDTTADELTLVED